MIFKARQQYPEYDDLPDEELMSRIHAKHYTDMTPDEFASRMYPHGRPNYDDLETAAVRGVDSLSLQEMDPTVKPMVKMTVKELDKLKDRIQGKIAVIANDTAYVIDPRGINPLKALQGILDGEESEALGYPSPGGCDCCVTKQGDIITDVPTMMRHAKTGNVAWGASGQSLDLLDKAQRVSDAIKRQT